MYEVVFAVCLVVYSVALEVTEVESTTLQDEKKWTQDVLRVIIAFRLGILFFKILFLDTSFVNAPKSR